MGVEGEGAPAASKRRNLLTILQRATQPEHGAEATANAAALLDHLVRTHTPALAEDIVAVLTDTPGELREVLAAALGGLDAPALRALDFALPVMHLQLLELALEVSRRHARTAKAALATAESGNGSGESLEHARSAYAAGVGQLGIRLSSLGRREEALATSQEAVDIYRALEKDRPDAFLSDLATSLINTGAMLSNLGRREAALAASQEAVDIYRALAKDRPDAFLPDLARSLNNTGAMLSNLGRREAALAASQEAVDIYRALAKDRPDAFLPDLAMSLGALSQTLAEAGRHAEAAGAAAEGLAAIAPLAERLPQAFGNLARALHRVYVQACENAGRQPDGDLLQRVARALGEEVSDSPGPTSHPSSRTERYEPKVSSAPIRDPVRSDSPREVPDSLPRPSPGSTSGMTGGEPSPRRRGLLVALALAVFAAALAGAAGWLWR